MGTSDEINGNRVIDDEEIVTGGDVGDEGKNTRLLLGDNDLERLVVDEAVIFIFPPDTLRRARTFNACNTSFDDASEYAVTAKISRA